MQHGHVNKIALMLATVVLVSGAAAADRESDAASTENAPLVRADQLIGTPVLDPHGDRIGKVGDLLLDQGGGSVTHVVVLRGGFLGMGAKRHAVPWQDLQLDDVTQVGQSQTYDRDRTPTVAIDTNKELFAQLSPPLDRRSWDGYAPEGAGVTSRRVTDILDNEVLGSNQAEIGEVADLVIDADRGSITYALVDYKGAWDLDTDVIAVPWSSVHRSGHLIQTPLDEDTARQLSYRDDVRGLNNVELAAATSSSAGDNGLSPTESARQVEERTGAGMGQQVTIPGTVESIMGAAAGTSPVTTDVLVFRLKADTGVPMTVDAGSQAALTRQSLKLSQGDKVTVTGHRMAARESDRGDSKATADDVIMAESIQKGGQTVVIERSGVDHTQHADPDKDK